MCQRAGVGGVLSPGRPVAVRLRTRVRLQPSRDCGTSRKLGVTGSSPVLPTLEAAEKLEARWSLNERRWLKLRVTPD
jgi:hypothetical protein